MSQTFIDGYKTCMKDFEEFLHKTITHHDGVTNGLQAFQAISDLAYWTHTQQLHIKQMQPEQNGITITIGM
jgi:hypothetical protein